MTTLILWALLSPLAGFLAGWVIGTYGHSGPRCATGNELLAAELARTNDWRLK